MTAWEEHFSPGLSGLGFAVLAFEMFDYVNRKERGREESWLSATPPPKICQGKLTVTEPRPLLLL